MPDGRHVDELTLRVDDAHLVDGDLRGRPYAASVHGTVAVIVDGDPVDHRRLPASADLLGTVRTLRRLLRTLVADGTARGYPFQCTCSDPGCTSVHWSLDFVDERDLHLETTDNLGDPIGERDYHLRTATLATATVDYVDSVLAILDDLDRDRFPWKDRIDATDVGREHYATTNRLLASRDELATLL
ncbi:hypothetical protein [Halorubellus salinus]|uniref:hypothetical protein n=1 Tax=Halorubellus salinus TaxID=755309 RepID=UPI001D06BDA1|nr:hypothetical protein [Halorubellus salinus]